MTYQVNDIVKLQQAFGGGLFTITGLRPTAPKNCYEAVNEKGKPYVIGDHNIAAKFGEADPASVVVVTKQDTYNAEAGQALARRMADFAAANTASPASAFETYQKTGYMAPSHLDKQAAAKWAHVATLLPGDPLTISRKGRKLLGKFLSVNVNAETRHICCELPGLAGTRVCPVSMVVVPA